MKIIVVGAGVAGCCAARLLRADGHRVTVVAEPTAPHSVAATAVLRRAYHKSEGHTLFDTSMELYRQWGIGMQRGGAVTNYRSPGRRPRHDNDWALLDPAEPLFPPDVTATVTAIDRDGVTLTDGSRLTADTVVAAVGADSKLARPGHLTYGFTWVHPDPAVLTGEGLRVHHFAPYKSIIAGAVGGHARLGSSSSTSAQSALTQAHDMLQRCAHIGIISSLRGWERIAGIRLRTDVQLANADGVWHFTGLHRTGYALAPAYAQRLAARITAGAAA